MYPVLLPAQQTGSTDIYARSGLGLLGVGRVLR